MSILQPGFLYWDGLKYITVISPGISGVAGGDLSGSYPDPSVVGIQGRPIASTIPTNNQVLAWSSTVGEWEPQTFTATVSGPAGGDLGGTYPNPSVFNIHGASVPASGLLVTGNVLQVNGASSLAYGPVNLSGGSNYIIGTLPDVNQAPQSMAGDVSGVTSNAVVIRIQGNSVSASPPSSNQIYIWNGSAWTPTSLSGDVSLTSGGHIQVTGLFNNPLPTLSPGFLNWTGSAWAFSASSGFNAGGDLDGTTTSQWVLSISGANQLGGAVPLSHNAFITAAATSQSYIDLTAANASYGYGKFLNYVEAPAFDTTGATQLNVGPTNATSIQIGSTTANGSINFVTKGAGFGISATLGAAGFPFNFAAGAGDYVKLGTSLTTQLTPGSLDVSGSLSLGGANATSMQIGNTANNASTSFVVNGSGNWQWVSNVTQLWSLNSNRLLTHVPMVEIGTAVANYNITYDSATAGATPQSISIVPQIANSGSTGSVAGTPGSLIVNVGTPVSTGNEAGLQVQRNGAISATIGPRPSSGATASAIWLVPGTVTSSSNWTFSGTSTQTTINVPSGGTIAFYVNNTAKMNMTNSALNPASSGGLTLGTLGQPWGTVYSQYIIATSTSAIGAGGGAWEFPTALSYGVISFSGNNSTTTGSNIYVTAQNASGAAGTNTGGSLYLLSGGTNGGAGVSGSVIVGISTTSGAWAPTGTTAVFQVLDSHGISFVTGNYSAVSGGSSSYGAVWLGPGITPSSTNYSLLNDNGTLYYNAISLSHTWRIANTNYMLLTTSSFYPANNQGLTLGTSALPWGDSYLTNFQWTTLIQQTTTDTQTNTVQSFLVNDTTTSSSAKNSYAITLNSAFSTKNYVTLIEVTWMAKPIGGVSLNWTSGGRVMGCFSSMWNGVSSIYAQTGTTATIVTGFRTGEESVSFTLAGNTVTIVINPGVDDTVSLDWQYLVTIYVC